tara:strand:+ start:1457 stop:1795 length:339 start_codon:yes stop_codon:yes gene_type:complete
MNWPPVKAWTNKLGYMGYVHFVAINYGGELKNRWVIMMSVIDSSVVLEVPWRQIVDSSDWECGWGKTNCLKSYQIGKNKCNIEAINLIHLSTDSGLTVPITLNNIRPWFEDR